MLSRLNPISIHFPRQVCSCAKLCSAPSPQSPSWKEARPGHPWPPRQPFLKFPRAWGLFRHFTLDGWWSGPGWVFGGTTFQNELQNSQPLFKASPKLGGTLLFSIIAPSPHSCRGSDCSPGLLWTATPLCPCPRCHPYVSGGPATTFLSTDVETPKTQLTRPLPCPSGRNQRCLPSSLRVPLSLCSRGSQGWLVYDSKSPRRQTRAERQELPLRVRFLGSSQDWFSPGSRVAAGSRDYWRQAGKAGRI